MTMEHNEAEEKTTMNQVTIYDKSDLHQTREWGKDFVDFHIPRYEELPNIPLYLDQVIGILNDTLEPFIEYGEDKLISGAMVNNYVKHKVIVAPVKKRYSKGQLCNLFVLSTMKKVFSIPEISALIAMCDTEEKTAAEYNHFCDELELALKRKFGDWGNGEFSGEGENRETVDLSRSMALAFANKLFVQKMIWIGSGGVARKKRDGESKKGGESGKKRDKV